MNFIGHLKWLKLLSNTTILTLLLLLVSTTGNHILVKSLVKFYKVVEDCILWNLLIILVLFMVIKQLFMIGLTKAYSLDITYITPMPLLVYQDSHLVWDLKCLGQTKDIILTLQTNLMLSYV